MSEMVTPEVIGRAMFVWMHADYFFDPSLVEQMWHEDPSVKAFWIAEAEFVIDLVRRTCLPCNPGLRELHERGQIAGQMTIEDVAE